MVSGTAAGQWCRLQSLAGHKCFWELNIAGGSLLSWGGHDLEMSSRLHSQVTNHSDRKEEESVKKLSFNIQRQHFLISYYQSYGPWIDFTILTLRFTFVRGKWRRTRCLFHKWFQMISNYQAVYFFTLHNVHLKFQPILCTVLTGLFTWGSTDIRYVHLR